MAAIRSTRAEGVRARLEEVRAAGADCSAHIVLYEGDPMITNELALSNAVFLQFLQKSTCILNAVVMKEISWRH